MRNASVYVCQKCGFESPKWQGQCPSCGSWNSLVETAIPARGWSASGGKNQRSKIGVTKPLRLGEVESLQFSRTTTGIAELDRVLGGGIVPGSIVLLAGEPGMGKSTLLTQLALELANVKCQISNIKNKDKNFKIRNSVYYICGEESPGQVKLRVERLSKLSVNSELYLLPEANVESIVGSLETGKPGLVIVDSIQTVWTERLSGMAGSVGQIRESANILREYAKQNNVPVFLVGHVTKEGEIAGPKILEHMVDTVLYIEGDKNHEFRILRAVKNRFGPTDEVGIFTMNEKGMEEVANPSGAFLSDSSGPTSSRKNAGLGRAGSVTIVTMEGLRPILVEIQALVVPSQLPNPRRIARGIDGNRLQILCAVLQKKAGIPLHNHDVYLSVSGGLKVSEPAADFGICLAVAGSYKNKTIPEHSIVVGEMGLMGEVRRVQFLEKRIKQAQAMGYKNIIGPQQHGIVSEAIRELLK